MPVVFTCESRPLWATASSRGYVSKRCGGGCIEHERQNQGGLFVRSLYLICRSLFWCAVAGVLFFLQSLHEEKKEVEIQCCVPPLSPHETEKAVYATLFLSCIGLPACVSIASTTLLCSNRSRKQGQQCWWNTRVRCPNSCATDNRRSSFFRPDLRHCLDV